MDEEGNIDMNKRIVIRFAAPEGELLAVMKDGTVGFRRDDSQEFSFGAKLPVG